MKKDRISRESSDLKARDLASCLLQLEQSYAQRVEEIADLKSASGRLEELVALLQRQLRNSGKRNHIIAELGSVLTKQQAEIAKPFFSPTRRRAKRRIAQDIDLVKKSDLFDKGWYLAMYADVNGEEIDPAVHFATCGAYQLLNPGPSFDSLEYHIAYPDVTTAGIPAFLHYLRNGQVERRDIFGVGLNTAEDHLPKF